MVKILLERGAVAKMVDDDVGITPLNVAADYGKLEVVKTLVEGGADPDRKERLGRTPLRMIKLTFDFNKLLLKGVGPHETDRHGRLMAECNRLNDVVQVLLQGRVKSGGCR